MYDAIEKGVKLWKRTQNTHTKTNERTNGNKSSAINKKKHQKQKQKQKIGEKRKTCWTYEQNETQQTQIE